MCTTVERDLKTLRNSKLMSSPEFKTMMVVLEKYHKDQTSATRRKENRELDLRPFLYDDGDTYEKPFYNILLKMLYEVASFKRHEKQREDLLKVYEWFMSNQKLLSGESDEDGRNGEMVSSRNKRDVQMPKLSLRPKSADGNCFRQFNETQDMISHREAHSRSALGASENERIRKNKCYNPLDRISVSLKVLPLNVRPAKEEYALGRQTEADAYTRTTKRNMSPSGPIYNTRNISTVSLPSSFVLKPYNQTTPPVSSPVSTPPISPAVSPPFMSPTLSPRSSPSPLARTHSPNQPSLSGHETDISIETPAGFHSPRRNKRESSGYDVNKGGTISPKQQGTGILSEDGVKIYDISNTALVADEEGDLFQNQVKQRLRNDTEAKKIEILENLQKDSQLLAQEQENLESQLIGEHEQYLKGYLFSEENGKYSQSARDTLLPVVNVYDISNHRPVSAVAVRDKSVRVESVLDMVQPVGHQMKYEREMRKRQHGISIWDTEAARGDKSAVHDLQRIRSAPACHGEFANGVCQTEMVDNSTRLKQTEPNLNPEKKAKDYTVHFPHQASREPTVKDFKTSGTVSPDTVRYQWTDDGFGNRTYIKKRTAKETQTGKSPRRSLSSANHDVAMTTGERGLDKRTMASLMIIRHLGTSHRRERDYFKFAVDDSVESISSFNEVDDPVPKQNVEYLPFWKQVPSKKGLTILNFPEKLEPPIIPNNGSEKKNSFNQGVNESKQSLVDPRNASPSPAEQIMHEMFSCLSPSRRTHGKKIGDTTSLSVNARSISPSIRQPSNRLNQGSLNQGSLKSGLTPAPSRPSSARRSPSPSNDNVAPANFSANFSHFCFDDDYELLDADYMRQREIWAAVNIQRIFRGHMARQYAKSLKQAERERQRKAAVALQSTFRGYLARKKLLEDNLMNYKAGVKDLQWAKDYKVKLREKEEVRNQRNQAILRKQNRQLENQQEQIMGVTASDMIHEIFNPPRPTKAQMKAAAITIQRYFRGWYVRKSLRTVKEKALKRTFSFNKFIKTYQDLVYRIQERYNIESPTTALQFHELLEYVNRLFKYEIAFGKIALNGTLKYDDILKYFAECGHHPSEKEVEDAIALVTKDTPHGRSLNKAEAVEVVFQIYIPKGTGLSLADVRKSTWVNPLINGQDVTKLLSKKDLKFTSLDKCLSLIANSQGDRSEVKELLRPPDPRIMNVVDETKEKGNNSTLKSTSGKQKSRPSSAQAPGGGNFVLARAQYHPVKPSGNKQGKRRRPVSGKMPK